MASKFLPDPERLFQPIPGENPCGELVTRADDLWAEIDKCFRAEERPTGDTDRDSGNPIYSRKEPDWEAAISVLCEALSERTKDLRLVEPLCFALAKAEGFTGLLAGLTVLREMLERYGNDLYPAVTIAPRDRHPRDDDAAYAKVLEEAEKESAAKTLEQRVAAVRPMVTDPRAAGRFLPPVLFEVPLSPAVSIGQDSIALTVNMKPPQLSSKGNRESDNEFDERKDRHAQKLAAYDQLRGKLDAAARNAPDEYYVDWYHLFQAIRGEMDQLRSLMSRYLSNSQGIAQVGVTGLEEAVRRCEAVIVEVVTRVRKGTWPPNAAASTTEAGAAPSVAAVNGVSTGAVVHVARGPIQTRAQAFTQLQEVVDFFRREHPDSPIPLLVERAISWGKMRVEKLIPELLEFTSVLKLNEYKSESDADSESKSDS